jgi:hypothetical protein
MVHFPDRLHRQVILNRDMSVPFVCLDTGFPDLRLTSYMSSPYCAACTVFNCTLYVST